MASVTTTTMMMMVGGGALPPPKSINFSARQLASSNSKTLGLSIEGSLPLFISASPSLPLVYCGRGDRKTAKGKRFNHSFGNARPRNKKKGRGPPRIPVPSAPPKKDAFEDNEVVKIDIDDSNL